MCRCECRGSLRGHRAGKPCACSSRGARAVSAEAQDRGLPVAGGGGAADPAAPTAVRGARRHLWFCAKGVRCGACASAGENLHLVRSVVSRRELQTVSSKWCSVESRSSLRARGVWLVRSIVLPRFGFSPVSGVPDAVLWRCGGSVRGDGRVELLRLQPQLTLHPAHFRRIGSCLQD